MKRAVLLLAMTCLAIVASGIHVMGAAGLDNKILASVNGYRVSKAYFESKYHELSPDYQSAFKYNKEGFLEQLIVRELLYQEAEKRDFAKKLSSIKDPEKKKDAAIRELIQDVSSKVQVTDFEIMDFYNSHSKEMNGASYEQARESIGNYLLQQKRNDAINSLIRDLRQKAKIIKNKKWLAEQEKSRPKNPLAKTLKSGKPTVLDLGSGQCIPCKMMKPIFAELERTYKGKANILLLDINEYRYLADKYQVRVIPTQIFFDKTGKQVWRHEGFLAKEEIVKKLKELGVE